MHVCEGRNEIDQEKGKYRHQPQKEKIAERVVAKPFCELPRTGASPAQQRLTKGRARNKKNKRSADGRANLCRDCAGQKSKQKAARNGEKGRARKRDSDRYNVDDDEGNDGHHAVLVDEVVNNCAMADKRLERDPFVARNPKGDECEQGYNRCGKSRQATPRQRRPEGELADTLYTRAARPNEARLTAL